MPKKGRKGSGGSGDSCEMPFHSLFAQALSAGLANITCNPTGLSARVLTEADCWAHFRLKRLMFRLHPASTAASNTGQAVGFVGGIEDTPPAATANVMDLIPSTYLGADGTVPTEWVNVSKSDLAGPFPWYKTVPGTADPTEEAPGQIVIAGNTTDAFALEVRGIFQFKTSVATTNTPAALEARRRLREERAKAMLNKERECILKLLAPPGQASTGTK